MLSEEMLDNGQESERQVQYFQTRECGHFLIHLICIGRRRSMSRSLIVMPYVPVAETVFPLLYSIPYACFSSMQWSPLLLLHLRACMQLSLVELS